VAEGDAVVEYPAPERQVISRGNEGALLVHRDQIRV
jgi:hypothetical protein